MTRLDKVRLEMHSDLREIFHDIRHANDGCVIEPSILSEGINIQVTTQNSLYQLLALDIRNRIFILRGGNQEHQQEATRVKLNGSTW